MAFWFFILILGLECYNAYYNYSAEEDVIGKSVYVKNFIEEDLVNFRAKVEEVKE